MIRIAVVEDDAESRSLTETYLARFARENGEEIRVHAYSDGLDFLNEYRSDFDVVVMDIELPHLDGIETARRMRRIDSTVQLIFLTNMAQYAIKGYDVDATDYILKPVGYFVFATKIKKALRAAIRLKDVALTVNDGGGIKVLRSSRVRYIEVADHNLIFHTEDGIYQKRGTLSETENLLRNQNFVRCNSCYLINLNYVTGTKDCFVFLGEEKLQISRPKLKKFKEALLQFCGRRS